MESKRSLTIYSEIVASESVLGVVMERKTNGNMEIIGSGALNSGGDLVNGTIRISEIFSQDPEAKAIIGVKAGWQGTVVSASLLEAELNVDGQTKKLSFTDNTVYMDGTKKLELSTLKVGQNILAIGYLKDNILETRRIIPIGTTSSPKTILTAIGQIADASKSSRTLLVIPIEDKNKEMQITVDDKTQITTFGKKVLLYSDLTKSMRIYIITTPTKNSKSYLATKIITLSEPTPKTTPSPSPKVAKPTKTQ